MNSPSNRWRLWLPFPTRSRAAADQRRLRELNIDDWTYRTIKMVHLLVSLIPLGLTLRYYGDPSTVVGVMSLVCSVLFYVVLTFPISHFWDGRNAPQ